MNQNHSSSVLRGQDYAVLVTVFAVILAVEYATGPYDLWDVFIGVLCLLIGLKFRVEALEKADRLFSFLTGCLLSLGLMSVLCGIVGLVYPSIMTLSEKDDTLFWVELFRFAFFLVVAVIIAWKSVRVRK